MVLVFTLPNAFPYHGLPKRAAVPLRHIDFGGFLLMIASITLLMVGFEEASNSAPWISARFLAPVLISIPCWLAFIVYERQVTVSGAKGQEPVFPWRFCYDRVMMGVIWYVPAAFISIRYVENTKKNYSNSFLTGAVFITCIVQIPLRFQAANGESPWHAGIRLIPFGLASPIGSILVVGGCSRQRLPPIYLLIPAALLQLIGLVFMSRLSIENIMWKGQYAMQVLTGLGCGMSIAVTTVLTPYVVEPRDLGRYHHGFGRSKY